MRKGGPGREQRNFYWMSLPRWTKAVACPSGEKTGRPRNASSRCLDEAGRTIARYCCARSRWRLRPCSGRPAYALSFPGARHFQAAYRKQLRPVSFHILSSLLPLFLRQLQILTARLPIFPPILIIIVILYIRLRYSQHIFIVLLVVFLHGHFLFFLSFPFLSFPLLHP